MAEIFVVEDDADLVYIYRTALAQAGHDVQMFRNTAEARAALLVQPPDLIFLDMNMPEENGATLIQDIRKDSRFDNMQIVVVTANQLWQRQLNSADISGFLVKPVSIHDIIKKAKELT